MKRLLGSKIEVPRGTVIFYPERLASSVCAAIFLIGAAAHAHDIDSDTASDTAGKSRVTIKTQGDKRVIEANGLPDHKPGQFPNRGNPNSISAQRYRFEISLKPQ